jgi:hypothetical protein
MKTIKASATRRDGVAGLRQPGGKKHQMPDILHGAYGAASATDDADSTRNDQDQANAFLQAERLFQNCRGEQRHHQRHHPRKQSAGMTMAATPSQPRRSSAKPLRIT